MTTPLPPHSGALPGGRGVQPSVTTTVASDVPASHVGMGATGTAVSPPAASGRVSSVVSLPAQGSVAQGPAPSSLAKHAIVPDKEPTKPDQLPLSTKTYG